MGTGLFVEWMKVGSAREVTEDGSGPGRQAEGRGIFPTEASETGFLFLSKQNKVFGEH